MSDMRPILEQHPQPLSTFPSDLPSQGKLVRIKVQARRFRCVLTDCRQRIFVERLDVTVTRPFARRTARLEGLVHHLGLALGGRPGQSFARRLLLPVSKDTLLRVVRRQVAPPPRHPVSSVSMTGPGSAVIDTGRLSVISSGDGSSTFCRIVSPRR